jgi:hypothetical protein
VRTWFKDKSLEDMGRKYWKKKSYLFQGFVRESTLGDDKVPENPIRRFVISPQIFNIVKAALMDPEMEELPTDYERGLDFLVTKTSKGGYADYSTSKYARKETALTEVELAAIEQYGLFNLADFLPKRPTEIELKVIKEMFEASVDGQAYDPDKWSAYYKPSGFGGSVAAVAHDDDETPAAKTTAAPAPTSVAEEDAPVATAPAVSAAKPSSQKAEDILAMIRNRQQKS